MKPIHLLCHCEAYQHIENDLFKDYCALESDKRNVVARWQEEEDLAGLVSRLWLYGLHSLAGYDDFYWGYTIEHISKEFDLLRIGHNYCINIEIKHQAGEDKILKQLRLNQYYLKSIHPQVYYFTYIKTEEKLYQFTDGILKTVSFAVLAALIERQVVDKTANLQTLFAPANFLVSPLMQAEDFLEERYFLTNQQQDFKNKILQKMNAGQFVYIALSGMAGTGKTLLLYDIAKEAMKSKKTAVLHIGTLSDGQHDLIDNGYPIYTYDELFKQKDCELLLIDEGQRLPEKQLDAIFEWLEERHSALVLAYDGYELLGNDIHDLENRFLSENIYHLSNHLRINQTLMQFITQLFEGKKQKIPDVKDHVELYCFEHQALAEAWLKYSRQQGYAVLNESLDFSYRSKDTIGLEFDKVAVLIDGQYNVSNGHIGAKQLEMLIELYQYVTRARNKLRLVFLNNVSLLNVCMELLQE